MWAPLILLILALLIVQHMQKFVPGVQLPVQIIVVVKVNVSRGELVSAMQDELVLTVVKSSAP